MPTAGLKRVASPTVSSSKFLPPGHGGTGAGSELNNLAIVWPPRRAPLIISIYTVRTDPTASADNHVLPAAAAIVARGFGLAT